MKSERALEREAARKAFIADAKVGDIFSLSWGWEQTNVDFWRVKSRTAATLELEELEALVTPRVGGFMCGTAVASDVPTGKVARVRGTKLGYGWLQRWDGAPEYVSWYA